MCIDLVWLEMLFRAFIESNTPFISIKSLKQSTGYDEKTQDKFEQHFNFLITNKLIILSRYEYDNEPINSTSEETYRITSDGLTMASSLLNRNVSKHIKEDLKNLKNDDISYHQVRFLCDKHASRVSQ